MTSSFILPSPPTVIPPGQSKTLFPSFSSTKRLLALVICQLFLVVIITLSVCIRFPQIAVTLDNRSEFVTSYVSFLLDSRHRRQFSSFLSGFRLVAADVALDLFRPKELQLLIAGTNHLDFQVKDWHSHPQKRHVAINLLYDNTIILT